MRSAKSAQVLIVGAGPTGLVLALWLTRLGVDVRIIDQAAQPATTSRAVVKCQPRTCGWLVATLRGSCLAIWARASAHTLTPFSQTAISYRRSWLSEGRAGGVQGGDRLTGPSGGRQLRAPHLARLASARLRQRRATHSRTLLRTPCDAP